MSKREVSGLVRVEAYESCLRQWPEGKDQACQTTETRRVYDLSKNDIEGSV